MRRELPDTSHLDDPALGLPPRHTRNESDRRTDTSRLEMSTTPYPFLEHRIRGCHGNEFRIG